jgi:hypothetical protein
MTGLSQIWRPPSVGCTRNKAYQEEDNKGGTNVTKTNGRKQIRIDKGEGI